VKILIAVLLLFCSAQAEKTPEANPDGKSLIKSKKIKHPGSKDGLYLIDEDGVYHYKVPTQSKKDYTMYFRFVSQSPPEISTNVGDQDLNYSDFYGSANLMGLDFIYEWQPIKNWGKAGFQLGAGFAIANGRGYFGSGDTREPLESYTLFSIPLMGGVIYRFEFVNRQWLVPYASAGLIYNGFVEYRDDGENTIVGSPAGYGAGGVLVNLTAFNKRLAFIMDREYGYSSLWLTFEYRLTQGFNEDIDISSDQFSLGIGVDY
jgi:hypothetical protein